MQTLQEKMKILGIGCWGIAMPDSIQPQEHSRGSGTDGILYDLRNPNGNRYVLYLYWNDGKWQWNYNWLENDWNANNLSALLATLFVSPPFVRGSFVWKAGHSIRQASDRPRLFLLKEQCIFCYQATSFPRAP